RGGSDVGGRRSSDRGRVTPGARLGVERRGTRKTNDPAPLRSTATRKAHLPRLRGAGDGAHTRIRSAVVGGWWPVLSRDRAPAVELQPAGRERRDGGSSCRLADGDGAGAQHRSGYQWGRGRRVFGAVAARVAAQFSQPAGSHSSAGT